MTASPFRGLPLSLPAIAALPVGELVAPGGAVLLWCTWPLVATGAHVEILRGWGFPAVTGGAWAKRTRTGRLRWGPGYVVRSVCEPWLIGLAPGAGIRGSSVANLVETLTDASLDGLAREHSRKPDAVFAMVEALTPGRRRLELFSRTDRPGWTSWGDQAGTWVAS
ncbi:hypothetical protein STVA_41620 [Allostella vacuolata]|nr:hypothetical protein STVA_41620 [Stella vacuolata]